MKLASFFSGLLLTLSLSAQLLEKPRDRMFKAVTIKGPQNVQQLKQSLNNLVILRNAYLKAKFSKDANKEELLKLQQDYIKLEVYHEKKYGMIPGMIYRMVNEEGSVSQALSDEQLNQISEGKESQTKQTDKPGNLKKYPQFELKSAKAIQDFVMAANQGKILNTKINKEKDPDSLKKLEDQKEQFDTAMKDKYGIRPNLDYVLEITSVSLYLVLKDEDLRDISEKEQKRYEDAYLKNLQTK